ncbi:M48 family peptidase [Helicobacter apodemus]|uniref:M48 family peptidase n=1 Tax=Helicobacter apodemus TaxID=135569 RepID=A0A4U8UE54_9HELI|nr:M48 family metallopeptidase [Helicobacter apodemus]TLE15670.1 M48 family peptidase [Helicobacter apodemus]
MILFSIYALFFTLPKITLSILQLNFLQSKQHQQPYILDSQSFKKAAQYSITKEKISLISSIFDLIIFGCWIFFGLAFLESLLPFNALMQSVIFLLIFLILQSLLSLPFEAYQKLIVDKAFGFCKGEIKLFISDTLKSLLLLILIGGIFLSISSWIILNIPLWEIYIFIVVAIFIIGANLFYPTFIAPLFNKFTPLDNPNLQLAIQNLLHQVGFQSNGVFVMDASKRDGRLNAYFGGLGNTKRVILFDTLLEKIPQNSLLAVLGHELGHFKHFDIYKMMILILSFFALLLFIIANLPQTLFLEANILPSPHSLIAFLILLSSPIGFYFTPIISYFSCKNEFNADKFGASLTSNEDLAQALLVLVKENNAFPLSHPLYIKFYYTHPPLMQRLKALHCEHLAITS